jgi:hypothetical protein
METKVATVQSKRAPHRILIEELCLFVTLLIFLAVLGLATWEIRLVKPMAFMMFAGLMAAGLVVAIADVESRRARNIGKQIKLSRPVKPSGISGWVV